MEENFFVEIFTQREDSFGIKVRTKEGNTGWINGFGICPQKITPQTEMVIPYYTVEKNGKTYYNYGEPKKKATTGAISDAIAEIHDELNDIRQELEELRAELQKG